MIRWAQYCAGTEYDILQTSVDIPYLEGQWKANLQQGLAKKKGRILQIKRWHQPPSRENNTYLMDQFQNDHSLTTANLRTLNYCGYKLKVEYASDITASDGKRILPCLQKITSRQPNNQTIQLVFPNQGDLPRTAWNL
eukprot:15366577-Ditylum_brightwellii.AAC.2